MSAARHLDNGKVATLPQGWAIAPLGDVVDVLDNMRIPVNKDERAKRLGTIPYYGATGQAGWIDDYIFDEELVLLGEDGAPFLEAGKPKAYMIRGHSWVNNHAHVLRGRSCITNAFLLHQLNQVDFHPFVSGTTRLKLPQGPMRQIPIAIAPLSEQRRIVAEIETQFTRLDAAVAALERARVNLDRLRDSMFRAAISGHLSQGGSRQNGHHGLPTGWRWATLTELGTIGRGKSKHRPRNDPRLLGGPYPFIQTGDVGRSTGYIREFSETYSEFGLAQSKLWAEGTLCITIAANIAETGILTFPACFPDSVVGFVRDGDPNMIRYLDFFFRASRQELERYAPATAQKNINLGTLERLQIPMPTDDEIAGIVDLVESRLSMIEDIETTIDANLKRAERMRQAILRKAFAGQLVLQDPYDEPASVLLERVRAERSTFNSARKSRIQERARKSTAVQRVLL